MLLEYIFNKINLWLKRYANNKIFVLINILFKIVNRKKFIP